jgi:hypothetical protein
MHLQCLPTHEGKSNVVCSVGFSVSATDGVNTASINNTLMMPYDENENFIEYEGLTSDTVLGWVQKALGAEGITLVGKGLKFMDIDFVGAGAEASSN